MNFFGIDKTTVKGFLVQNVNFDKLEKSGALVVKATNKSFYTLIDGKSFEYIKIVDENIFKSFKAGIKINGNAIVKYAFLDMSISPLNGNNLVPLTIEAYKNQLKKVFEYLENMYGVNCSELENTKFEVIELNATIQLNNDFNQYIRIFQTLMSIAPKTYKKELEVKDKVSVVF